MTPRWVTVRPGNVSAHQYARLLSGRRVGSVFWHMGGLVSIELL